MPKLFDVRHPDEGDYEALKSLWIKCFDDAPSVVERFFENAVTPENAVAAFNGDSAVSVLYTIDSTITNNGAHYKALYVYAVCTDPDFRGRGLMKACFDFLFDKARERGFDYLFLVPANEELFPMYQRLGFETGFFVCESKAYSRDYTCDCTDSQELAFEDYKNIRSSFSNTINLATLGEKGFNAFLSPKSETVKAIKCGDGYAVFEIEGDSVTVHELFGNKECLLSCIFKLTKADILTVRVFPGCGNSKPSGMYLSLGDAPQLKNAFFGIPYGG